MKVTEQRASDCRYPALLLSELDGPAGLHSVLAVPLVPKDPIARPRLTDEEALTRVRQYRGCAGAECVSDELLQWCAAVAARYHADVRWLRWADDSECLVIRTPGCPPLADAAAVTCYRAARAELERAQRMRGGADDAA